MLTLFTILSFIYVAHSQPYMSLQNLTQPTDGVEGVSISDDNSIIAAGCFDRNVYVYRHNGDQFYLNQTLTQMQGDVQVAEISGDGRWLISSGYDSNLYVYYNDNTQFTLNQTITMGTSTTVILAAGISDNEWIVFGNSVGDVFVFKHNGASFIQHQQITLSSGVYSISLTYNHKSLAIGLINNLVHTYQFINGTYQLQQTITYTLVSFRRVHLTDDRLFLSVTARNTSNAYLYLYNGTQYQQIASFNSGVQMLSSSLTQQLYIITTTALSNLYNFTGSSFQYAQNLAFNEDYVWFHTVSKDKSYIILGMQGFIKIYIINDTSDTANTTQGDATTESNVTEGNTTEVNATQVVTPSVNVTEGNATQVNATEVNATEGDGFLRQIPDREQCPSGDCERKIIEEKIETIQVYQVALIIGGFFALSGVVGGLIIYFYFFYKKSTMSIYDFEDNGKGKVGGEGPTMTKIKIQNEI